VANRAFARISNLSPAGDGTHNCVTGADCVVLNEADEVVGTLGGSIVFDHTANFHTIHEMLADNIRNNNNDPSLVVLFLDSPGRY